MTEGRKRANDFLREYYALTDEEPCMRALLDEADGLRNDLGGELPPPLDFAGDLRERLMTVQAMRRMMESVSAVLSDSEKSVMRGVYRDRLSADELAADLNRERSDIYRIKNRMLDRVSRVLGA